MQWTNTDIATLPRQGAFPFRVALLYTSARHPVSRQPAKSSLFEIALRLNSTAGLCLDTYDGAPVNLPFPNVAIKFPQAALQMPTADLRDTIAFAYKPEVLEHFQDIGLKFSKGCHALSMTPVLQNLIQEFRKAILQLYLPGTPDRIDWICFQICRELHYGKFECKKTRKLQEKVADIAVWLQMHYDTAIDFDSLAMVNGLSRTSLFREWRKHFPSTPLQYLLDLRLENAKTLLEETNYSIREIIRMVHFSGSTAFHTKFMEKYGVSPKDFRKRRP